MASNKARGQTTKIKNYLNKGVYSNSNKDEVIKRYVLKYRIYAGDNY
jgi:hypothetical protein